MEKWETVWALTEQVPAAMLLFCVEGTPRLLAANREAERLFCRSAAALCSARELLPPESAGSDREGTVCARTRLVRGRPVLEHSRRLGKGLVLCVLMPLPDALHCRLDPLTGLLDRAAFQRGVDAALHCAPGLCAFLILDLDNFKQVNDSRGHPAGDALLVAVAGRLRAAFRRNDLLGRLGGDEFAVFLQALPSREYVAERADGLLRELSRCFPREEMSVTCSAGVSFCPDNGRSFRELYARADEALYASKRGGRARCTLCPPSCKY